MSISMGTSCAPQHLAGVLLAITLGTTIATSQAQPLGAETLEQLFAGSDAHFGMDTRPSRGWTSALWKFETDGTVAGYLFTSAYIADRSPVDSVDNGKWWVRQGRLCTQWDKWDGGKAHCYVIRGKGDAYTASDAEGMFSGLFTLIR